MKINISKEKVTPADNSFPDNCLVKHKQHGYIYALSGKKGDNFNFCVIGDDGRVTPNVNATGTAFTRQYYELYTGTITLQNESAL